MRKIVLLLAFVLIASSSLKAQNFQGQAIYQTKVNVSITLDSTKMGKQKADELQKMMQKHFEKKYILDFNQFESIYKEEEKLDQPGGSGSIRMMGFGGDVYYKNIKEKRYVNQKESFSKEFLIKDSLPVLNWELNKESKMIGDYLCFKATAVKQVRDHKREYDEMEKEESPSENAPKYYKDLEIVAWYTPEIPVNNGPSEFWGLPGLILELHRDKTIYLCEKITINPKEAKPILEPDKGKEVTQDEYDAIMEEKSNEMREMYRSKKGSKKRGEGITITIGG